MEVKLKIVLLVMGVVSGMIALWGSAGFPIPATKGDFRQIGIEVIKNRIELIRSREPTTTEAERLRREREIKSYQNKMDRLEARQSQWFLK